MKNKLITISLIFSLAIIAVTIAFYVTDKKENSQDKKSEQIIALNEIEQLARLDEHEVMYEKLIQLQNDMRGTEVVSGGNNKLLLMCGICLVFLFTVFSYVYYAVLRPFNKMKMYAHKISQGNFDVSLDYERSNYFGEFTWAFDSMRSEITKARASEHEAVENNKTVIATLSHDIKTPISSIRAYAEGLDANLDGTPEKRSKYLNVLMTKCDEVSRLTDDLFIHSISDLDKLKISAELIEACGFLDQEISEIAAERNDIRFKKPDFSALVLVDANRLVQITENLINNARKYAKTDIDISISKCDTYVDIHFRDYGTGIPNEDIPFIFDKFYRGRNCGDEQGSGLGLYIVKHIIDRMQGKIMLHNHSDGLEVIISLPIISQSS